MGPHNYEFKMPEVIQELEGYNKQYNMSNTFVEMIVVKLNDCYKSAIHHNKVLKDLHFKKIQENFGLKAEIQALEKQIEKLQGN